MHSLGYHTVILVTTTQVLVKLWTGDNDLVRIGAFLCLRQVIQHSPQSLESVVKVKIL